MKILLTGVGGDIGQNIIKCLKERNDIEKIVGIDIDNYAAGRNLVDDFFIAPTVDKTLEYKEFIKNIIEKFKITYLIPSTEQEIKFINSNLYFFSNLNIKILINNSKIINIFLDKFKTIKFFQKNGIKCPRTYLLSEYKGNLSYPVIFKSFFSSGSKGVFKVYSLNEIEEIKKKYKDGIIQEDIGSIDEEYTIGVFSDGENIFSIGFKRYLGYGSMSKLVELINDPKIQDLAEKIAKLSELKGSMNIQVRKRNGDYIPFEVNPRISSTVYFRNYFGFKDVNWWIDLFEGKKINYEKKYIKGIGVRTINEVFFDLELIK